MVGRPHHVTKIVQLLLFLAALGALAFPVAWGLDRAWGRDVVLMKSAVTEYSSIDMNRSQARSDLRRLKGEERRRVVVSIYGEPIHTDLTTSRVLVIDHQRLTIPKEDKDITLHPTAEVAGSSDPIATAKLIEDAKNITFGSLIAIVVLMLIRRGQVKRARRHLTY